MWYCTACGKRNISNEALLLCDKCDMKAVELKAKGEGVPALYCHCCGNQNRSESGECERCSYNGARPGELVVDRGNIRLLLNKIDTLQVSIDKLQDTLTEGKAGIPVKEDGRASVVVEGAEQGKEPTRGRRIAEEPRAQAGREPCPECNPDGNSSHKGKCRYCDGVGWWPCRKCGGEGVVKGSALGIFTDNVPKCPKCHGGKWFGCGLCESPAADLGNGKVKPGDGLCRRCHGTGYL